MVTPGDTGMVREAGTGALQGIGFDWKQINQYMGLNGMIWDV